MLRATKTYALCTKFNRCLTIKRRFCIGANFKCSYVIGPSHHTPKITRNIRLDHFYSAEHYLTCATIKRNFLTTYNTRLTHAKTALRDINTNISCTRHASTTHPARNHSCMRSHSTADRQNTFSSVHSMYIFR